MCIESFILKNFDAHIVIQIRINSAKHLWILYRTEYDDLKFVQRVIHIRIKQNKAFYTLIYKKIFLCQFHFLTYLGTKHKAFYTGTFVTADKHIIQSQEGKNINLIKKEPAEHVN